DLEHVAAAAARNELVGHGDRFVPAHGLNGLARRYEPEQRQLGGAGLPLGRHDFYGPALVVGAADVAFALEVGEMLVHGGQGLKAELSSDLLEARSVALGRDVARNEVQDLALTASERHAVSRRQPEANLPENAPNARMTGASLDAILSATLG